MATDGVRITHDHLVQQAGRWLRNQGCGVVLLEMKANTLSGEIPDAIGWRGGDISIVVECKTSRADYRRDACKDARLCSMEMGDWRFYLCPEGLIQVEDLPPKYGLLWLKGTKVLKVHGVPPNTGWGERMLTGHKPSEMAVLYSALRRKQ